MKRRDLIAAAIGLASCGSFGARAQLPQRMRRIGLLLPVEQRDLESQVHVAAFRQQFQQLGWTESRNAQLDLRWATDEANRISNFATELVSLQPDAILARSTPVTAALSSIAFCEAKSRPTCQSRHQRNSSWPSNRK